MRFVDRIVFVNETDYHVHVDVRTSTGGWLGLTTVSAGETAQVAEVIEQGDMWTFRFSYGRYQPVQLDFTRNELIDADWRVEVPPELEEKLRDDGVPVPP
ncbi:MAG: hypothetical protein ABR505_11450 [Actinomycetota bacterium]